MILKEQINTAILKYWFLIILKEQISIEEVLLIFVENSANNITI